MKHTLFPHRPVTRGSAFHPKVHSPKTPRRPAKPTMHGPHPRAAPKVPTNVNAIYHVLKNM